MDEARLLEGRLVRIEQGIQGIAEDVTEVKAAINGGQGLSWERSIRGRLHLLESDNAASKNAQLALAQAETLRDRQFSKTEKIIALGLGVAAALGPWISFAISGGHPRP